MASSKVMASSNSRNSDLARRSSSSLSSSVATKPKADQNQKNNNSNRTTTKASSLGSMTVDGLLRNVYDANPTTESTLLDAQITLIDTPPIATAAAGAGDMNSGGSVSSSNGPKTVDDVWREIVSGDRKGCKEEAPDEMMTLEDFLARAGAVEEDDVKSLPPPATERLSGGLFSFDSIPPSPLQALDKVDGSIIGFGNGVEVIGGGGTGTGTAGGVRGKRGRAVLEPLDKAAQQRQRRMIKNRESAARSRERKQAYQVELESLAVRLEEENERLMKEKAERTKERFKQLMEKIIPVEEKRRAPRVLRRVHSFEW
ncbi:G-box-binding factor 4 [Ziziphus jujuba]|uniref:G-box-binding factor 4 n=1 Tax=Ziziphus jujuba TaxID=326968 RepID=A0A6P4A0W8_ZIZJJ|nr:G-box-binding factor 4 [Ziziphus jujuba]